jgi:hypothetical protein
VCHDFGVDVKLLVAGENNNDTSQRASQVEIRKDLKGTCNTRQEDP